MATTKTEVKTEDKDTKDVLDPTEQVKIKIVHLLSIYPTISRSMLQVGLGPGLQPMFWDPALTELTKEGFVQIESVSIINPENKRSYGRTKISLTENGKAYAEALS